jgi:hypothetical protein
MTRLELAEYRAERRIEAPIDAQRYAKVDFDENPSNDKFKFQHRECVFDTGLQSDSPETWGLI